jgi:hypothetical protein
LNEAEAIGSTAGVIFASQCLWLGRFPRLGWALLTAGLFVAQPAPLCAATATLAPKKDNTIYGDGSSPLSNGAGAELFVGRSGQGRVMRSLVAFDVAAAVPAGSTVTAVSLTVTVNTPHANTLTAEVRRLLADWGEGTSDASRGGGGGATAATSDATWLARFYNTATWTTPGGDFADTLGASQTVGTTGPATFSTTALVADVQGWVDNPASNFGWLLKAQTETNSAVRFSSRQGANPPSLVITYTPPTAVAPSITTQPANVTVTAGQGATFTVVATGFPAPTFQWRKGGANLKGATSASYSIASAQPAHAGNYDVVVTLDLPLRVRNSADSVTSSVATLTVQPGSGSVSATLVSAGAAVFLSSGGNLTLDAAIVYTGFTPSALGFTITLPAGWSFVSVGGANVPQVPPNAGDTGALSFAYTSFPANQANFSVTLAYPAGLPMSQSIAASAIYLSPQLTIAIPSVLLTRIDTPSISTQPADKVAAVGATVTFSVVATSASGLTYQWRKGGVAIAGETNATFTLTNVQLAAAGGYSVVVSNAAGPITSRTATLAVVDMRATHAIVGAGYVAGGTVTIANTFAYTGTFSGLGWQVLLPDGWSLASTNSGDVAPQAGDTSALSWAWFANFPASGAPFTYTLNVPANATSQHSLSALVYATQNGATLQLLAQPDPLTLNRITFHSADTMGATTGTSPDNRLNLAELLRVIELYNYRAGTVRTGQYTIQSGTEDGFTPGPNGIAITTVFHSADTMGGLVGTPRDGKINLPELLRVIELYNYRSGTVRTGQYHAQSGTEDGFAPGP